MSMTKTELKNAFREAVSYEFREIPRDNAQINYTFSAEFEQKINKIISKEKRLFRFINTTYKRVAVFIIAFITLFTSAFSVEAIREPILRFIIEIFDNHNEYSFTGNISTTIEKEYKIADIPQGFKQIDYLKSDAGITTIYENEKGEIIRFSQILTNDTAIYVDNENTETKIIKVLDCDVYFSSQKNSIVTMWIKDYYVLKFACHGEFTEEDIIKMIESIEEI